MQIRSRSAVRHLCRTGVVVDCHIEIGFGFGFDVFRFGEQVDGVEAIFYGNQAGLDGVCGGSYGAFISKGA